MPDEVTNATQYKELMETEESENEESSSESEVEDYKVKDKGNELATAGKVKKPAGIKTKEENSEDGSSSSEGESDDEKDTNINNERVVGKTKKTIGYHDSDDSNSESDDECFDLEISFKTKITEIKSNEKKEQFRKASVERSIEAILMKDLNVVSDLTESGQSNKNTDSRRKTSKVQNGKQDDPCENTDSSIKVGKRTEICEENIKKNLFQGYLSEMFLVRHVNVFMLHQKSKKACLLPYLEYRN